MLPTKTMPRLLKPTDDPRVFDFEFDNTSLENFVTCSRRAQHYSVFKRERAGTNSATYYGTVIHSALDLRKHAAEGWQNEQPRLIMDLFEKEPAPMGEWRTPELAILAMQKYNAAWPANDELFRIVPGTIELPFRVLIGDAHLNTTLHDHLGSIDVGTVRCWWTGRIDAIVEWDTMLFVMDHKTSSVMGQQFWHDFELSSQMQGYTWASRQLGHNVAGALIDCIACQKPAVKGPIIHCERNRFWYSEEHLTEWQNDTFTHITDFLEHWSRNYFPKGVKWCHGKYGECPYWNNCILKPDDRMANLMSYEYKDVEWSPLKPR